MSALLVYLFPVLVFLVGFHYWYDGIFIPAHLLKLRFRLDEIRDRLRRLKLDLDPERLPDDTYFLMESSIDGAVRNLPRIEFFGLIEFAQRMDKEPQLREIVDMRRALVERCGLPELNKVDEDTFAVLVQAAVINSGGWFIYLLPLVVFVAAISSVFESIRTIVFFPEFGSSSHPLPVS